MTAASLASNAAALAQRPAPRDDPPMRSAALLVAALVACSPPVDSKPLAPPPAVDPTPAPDPPPSPGPPPPTAETPATTRAPNLCTALCVDARQMQAMSIEAIEAQCATECEATATNPATPECTRAAAEARKRAEKSPMSRRAPAVWKQVDAALACGHHDALLERLAAIGTANTKTRDADFLAALAGDPFLSHTCRAGIDAAHDAAKLPQPQRTAALVQSCPLTDVDPQGAAKDLPIATLLAIETVAHRWQAYGATSSDHAILLDTLRLASALAAAK